MLVIEVVVGILAETARYNTNESARNDVGAASYTSESD